MDFSTKFKSRFPVAISFLLFVMLIVLMANGRLQAGTTDENYQRLEGLHNHNLLRTVIYNYGSIGRPNTEPSFEWPLGSNHGYAYEFGLIVGAEVIDAQGQKIHIFSEGLVDGGDRSPEGEIWGWQPLPGYAAEAPNQSMAFSDDPSTWPATWRCWPDSLVADLQSYWVMDDRYNREFSYYPFVNDSDRQGLGLQVTGHSYQWANTFDEDFLLVLYDITNVSDKALSKVVAGVFGDPHIGGFGDFSDDFVDYINNQGVDHKTGNTYLVKNLVYCYDNEGSSNDFGIPWQDLGWLGIHLLETPRGADGLPLGLTSVEAPDYGSKRGTAAFDEQMWSVLQPGNFKFEQNTDNVVAMGSGYFELPTQSTEHMAVAFLIGRGQQDLIWNALNADIAYAKIKGQQIPEVVFKAPQKNAQYSQTVSIEWEVKNDYGMSLLVDLYYSAQQGDGFYLIASDLPASGSYDWDVSQLDDGYNYCIAAIAHDDQARGRGMSDYFIINHPDQETNPEILLVYPRYEKTLNGTVKIQWRAGSADGEDVFIRLYYRQGWSSGAWHILKDSLANTGYFNWNTRELPNGFPYSLKLSAFNEKGETHSRISTWFTIDNTFKEIADSSIKHIAGLGEGTIQVQIVNPQKTTGHRYQITFDDTSSAQTTYDVMDLETGLYVLRDAHQLTPDFAGPEFDGLRLLMDTYQELTVNEEKTGWINGQATVTFLIEKYKNGIYPKVDYEIRFYDTYVDTSLMVNPQPIKFKVWDVTNNQAKKVIFSDNDRNGEFTVGDYIYILEKIEGVNKASWKLKMQEPDSGAVVLPQNGDVFLFATHKPFSSSDIFEFKAPEPEQMAIEPSPKVINDFNISQNFPNPFNSTTVFNYYLPKTAHVRLTIYDINGRQVIRLVDKKQPVGHYRLQWHGQNSHQQPVASGVYFYKFEAGSKRIWKKCLFIK